MTDEIRFYRATGKYGFLSNLYPCKLVCKIEGNSIEFMSAEHAYQWRKPDDKKTREWIRMAPYPRLAAIAGHGLLPYDVNPIWNKHVALELLGMDEDYWKYKVVIMRGTLLDKFGQNPDLADKLIATGDAILIEDSKADSYWGVGKKGTGRNMLGRCLMDVRETIRMNRER
jgi:ribA/ribD-fused uncharacterized protein